MSTVHVCLFCLCLKAEAAVQAGRWRWVLGLQRVHIQEQRRGVQVLDVWCQEGDVNSVSAVAEL